MPNPRKGESKDDYIGRFMSSTEARRDYPDRSQRYAVANSMWKRRNK
jgi:hypothetical protein